MGDDSHFLAAAVPAAPTVKEVAHHWVSPPPAAVPNTRLPLTFFDVLWLVLGPVETLLFYQCTNITTTTFLTSHFPALRHSLSITLTSFFSLAGKLSQESDDFVIEYTDGDSVSLTVAESAADFAVVMADEAKDARLTRPLVPSLPPPNSKKQLPLLALKFTVFPGAGFTLGMTLHPSAADGNGYSRFLKSWAAVHRSGGKPQAIRDPPVYDRGALVQLDEDKRAALVHIEAAAPETKRLTTVSGRTVRATFILDRDQLERLQARISSATGVRPTPWVAACSLVWVCLTKVRGHEDRTVHFNFVSGCRTRIEPNVPDAYMGNCIGMVCCEASGLELAGEEGGLAVASEVIQAGIRALDGRAVERLKETVCKFVKMQGGADRVLPVAGSPKLRVYETDFGWGPPKKVEMISIDSGGKGISVSESRKGDGGLEVGLAGPPSEIERFACFLNVGLASIAN